MPLADGLVRRPGVAVSVGWRRCKGSQTPPFFATLEKNKESATNRKGMGWLEGDMGLDQRPEGYVLEVMPSNSCPYIQS
jgi:hypothetical protein